VWGYRLYPGESAREPNWKRWRGTYGGDHGGGQDPHRVVAPVEKKKKKKKFQYTIPLNNIK
jgi:hypothetical protein